MRAQRQGWVRLGLLSLSAYLMVILSSGVLMAQDNFRASPYFQALAQSDRFYREGNLQMAERLASPVKPQFSSSQVPPQAFSDPSRLSGAASVYLRTAREGLGGGKIGRAGEERFIHESKIYEPLQKLTENYPDFLPGHILLAHACEEDPRACRDNSRTDQPRDAVSVMERASALFPDQPAIIKEKIAVLDREAERDDRRFIYWLEAAIAARQFALTYPDDPEVGEFNALAEKNMRRFQRELNRYRLEGRLLRGMAARTGGGDTFLALIELGERDYGDQIIAPQIRRRRDLVTDPILNDYVNQIGHKLARASGCPDLNYEFFIVDDASINASAFTGGKIIVNKGAILAARSEAELAGLLAHEVAHAALSHGYLRMLETSKLEYFRAIFGRFPIFGGLIGDYFRGAQAEFSRRNEQQADILGTKLLATTPVASGSSSLRYSADGLYGFMNTLRQRSGRTQTGWLDSHPAPPARVSYLEHLILTNRYNRYAYEGIERHTDIREYLMVGKLPTDIAASSSVAVAPSPAVTANAPEPLWGLPTDLDPRPSQPSPAVSDRPAHPVGPIALNISQNNDQVRIEITGAEISPSGSFSLRFTVYNNSRRRFAFVPIYSQVLDANNQAIKARFSLVDSSSGEAFAEPGGRLDGQVQVIGHPWQGEGRQGLSLLIKEATVGGRVFRIGF
ncbi:M48 family metalloprotease [Trichothermofontia sp.]